MLKAQAYITDALIPSAPNQTRQLAKGTPPVLLRSNDTTCPGGTRQVVVDSTPKGARQEMLGFGAAWTDSAVHVFDTLEESLRSQVMDDLFGQDGNNMGACSCLSKTIEWFLTFSKVSCVIR